MTTTQDEASIIYDRIRKLEEGGKDLTSEVNRLNLKLDTALLTLTNNVNNLTQAIKILQESQQQTNSMHHSLIVLQERATVVPEIQRELNRVIIDMATQNVILKGIRFLAGAVAVSFIGAVVAFFVGA